MILVKVYIDYKSKCRAKLRKQEEDRKKTGGGPANNTLQLTPMETQLDRITSLSVAVRGVPTARHFEHNNIIESERQLTDDVEVILTTQSSSAKKRKSTKDDILSLLQDKKEIKSKKMDEAIQILAFEVGGRKRPQHTREQFVACKYFAKINIAK